VPKGAQKAPFVVSERSSLRAAATRWSIINQGRSATATYVAARH
jgi:hypothetical protein